MHLFLLRELSVASWFTINLSYTKKYWDYLLSLLCKDGVTCHILSFTWPTKAEGFLCSSGKLRPYIYTRAPLTPCMLKEMEISFITMFKVTSQDTLDIKKKKNNKEHRYLIEQLFASNKQASNFSYTQIYTKDTVQQEFGKCLVCWQILHFRYLIVWKIYLLRRKGDRK